MGRKRNKVEKKEASNQSCSASSTSKIPLIYKLIPPALLSLITAVFYRPSLKYDFQFDDLANITKKFNIRFADPLGQWWHNRRWMGEWLNRLNYDYGRFDPYGYRLINLMIHIFAGILVFFLILEGCSRLKKSPFFSKHALSIATTTAGLFMLHPVQTQTVSYVIQARLEGLATLFVVGTLFLILKGFQVQNKIGRYSLLTLAALVGFISCGTKEIAIVSPMLAILTDWFFIAEQDWQSFKKRIWFYGLFSFVIFAKFIHYLSLKLLSNIITLKSATANNRGNILTTHAHDMINPLAFLISSFKVMLHYFVIFLIPIGISVEYDWKLSESFFALDSFFPFLALGILLSLAVYSLIKKKHAFFGFGILWFFIGVAPRSTIIPSPELICDYKTYLSSVGWLFIIATFIVYLVSIAIKSIKSSPSWLNKPMPQIALFLVLSLPVGYGAMSRNTVWSSSVAFWENIAKNAPLKARAHNNLGVALSEEHRYDKAIPLFLEAIRLDRHYSDPWSNLAVAYSAKDKIDKAIAALKNAIRIFPHYPEAYNNLGTLLIKKKNYVMAEKILKMALKIRPHYGKGHYNLGRMYLEKNEMEKSWECFKRATEGDLDNKEGFYTLGQVSVKLKKFDEAAKAFEESLKRGAAQIPEQREKIYFSLANSYFMCKQYEKAEKIYAELLRIKPNDHRCLYNYAETLYTNKKYEEASIAFEKLVKPPFRLAQASFRYANALEQLNKYEEAKAVLLDVSKSEKLPAHVRNSAKKEYGRLKVQQKINSGNCTLTMSDLQQAFKKTGTS